VINTRRDDVTRRWALRLSVCLVAGAAALTGCSNKQEASESLPTTSTSTPTEKELPPLGPEEFQVPDEAREKTPAGALAFGKYYMELGTQIGLGRASAKSMGELSTAECRLCRQVVASFAEDQAAGYTRRGSSSTFEEYGPPVLAGDKADIGFVFTQSADTVVDRSGNEVPERAGAASGELQSGMQLTWDEQLQCWLVSNLTVG
jgi:hypothetical protein